MLECERGKVRKCNKGELGEFCLFVSVSYQGQQTNKNKNKTGKKTEKCFLSMRNNS